MAKHTTFVTFCRHVVKVIHFNLENLSVTRIFQMDELGDGYPRLPVRCRLRNLPQLRDNVGLRTLLE